jgi:hypothetical protein
MTISQKPPKNQSGAEPKFQAVNRLKYAQWRTDVSELLLKNGFQKESERWQNCNSSPRTIIKRDNPVLPPQAERVWVCSASHEHDAVVFCPSCCFRICPDCAPKQTARLIARYFPVIDNLRRNHPEWRLRKITLTRKIQLGERGFAKQAQEGFLQIAKAMKKTVGNNWNKNGAGLLANWEVGETGHKLHFHCIYFGPWVSWQNLSRAWLAVTGDSFIVYVQAVKRNWADWEKAVMETLKYATKFYKEDKETGEQKFLSPELTYQLFLALKGARRIRSYGSFFGLDMSDSDVFTCSECDEPMVSMRKEHWRVWVETGFSPGEWLKIVSPSLLQYKPANKSPPPTEKTSPGNVEERPLLPGFENIPIKGTSHYDV